MRRKTDVNQEDEVQNQKDQQNNRNLEDENTDRSFKAATRGTEIAKKKGPQHPGKAYHSREEIGP